MRCVAGLVAAVLVTLGGAPVRAETEVSAEPMREHIQYLASDELGGRAPGSIGEQKTIEYLTAYFEKLGYAPGNPDGTFVQSVPLVGSTVTNRPSLRLDGAEGMSFVYGGEFMAWTLQQIPGTEVKDAELVFVGYGIVAPEYDWDDYKDVDVAGKVIVMLVNDPPHPDQALFGGKAMTYYGRWTYKYEIAAEKGAAGAIIVHNTETAGYPWNVVENSWSGEQFNIVLKDKGASRCAMESWVQEPVARRIFSAAGLSLDDARASAVKRDFRPIPMGLRATVKIENRLRELTSHNVVARLEGDDERLAREHIVYTAHWDHLGISIPVEGDSIYNGALDNASGVAGVLEVARAFSGHRNDIKRSVLFLMTTAEESGLLGAAYYATHPLYPLAATVANINVDGLNIWGRSQDMVIVGYGQSDLDNYLEHALVDMDRYIAPDSEPEKGYYYRSDHFRFAKVGVPALYADSGVEFRDRPEGWGLKRREEYTRERYHKPQDEYDASWDLSGAVEDMEALFRVGLALATSDRYPRWSETSEFKRVREESLRGSR